MRRAISAVLATFILISITLLAAVAIAGFILGLFGTFNGVHCTLNGHQIIGNLTLNTINTYRCLP